MNEVSAIELFLQAGIVVKSVMIVLIFASIISWIIIFERYIFFRKANENRFTFVNCYTLTNCELEFSIIVHEVIHRLDVVVHQPGLGCAPSLPPKHRGQIRLHEVHLRTRARSRPASLSREQRPQDFFRGAACPARDAHT